MKKLNYLFLLLISCTFITTNLTSCIDDDDDTTTLEEQETARRLNMMQGNYNGKIYSYFVRNDSIKTDSLVTSFTIRTDSTLTVNLPVSMLANAVTGTANEDLRNTLKKEGPKTVKFKLFLHDGYRESSPNTYGFYTFPISAISFKCQGEEMEYNVEIGFTTAATYFYTSYITSSGAYQNGTAYTYIAIGNILVNGESYWISPIPFLLIGK